MVQVRVILVAFGLLLQVTLSSATNADGWRDQVIFQILTDRFAKTDQSSSACQDLSNYCGGTWQAAAGKLDYVTQLGATALWISPIPDNTK